LVVAPWWPIAYSWPHVFALQPTHQGWQEPRVLAGRAASLVKVLLPKTSSGATLGFEIQLDRDKLRAVRQREGRYLLRTKRVYNPTSKLLKLAPMRESGNPETVVSRQRS